MTLLNASGNVTEFFITLLWDELAKSAKVSKLTKFEQKFYNKSYFIFVQYNKYKNQIYSNLFMSIQLFIPGS